MEFGVQLFSLKGKMKSEKGVEEVFSTMQKWGVKNIQLSGGCKMPASKTEALRAKYGLNIVVTHMPYDRIVNDLDALIAEHKTFGCDTIGLGMMPNKYRANNYALFDEFVESLKKASEKLAEHGMNLAYHNHWFEFDKIGDKCILDLMAERIPKLQFILDTYWVKFAKKDFVEYIGKLKGRLINVHFKDMTKILGVITFFGDVGYGSIDFKKLIPLLEDAGCKCALIEKDFSLNPYKSVKRSWDYLSSIK